MSTHRRVKSKDEELGKRDDDFRPRSKSDPSNNMMQPWRWRKRRIFVVLAAIILLYFLFLYIPTDLEPIDGGFESATQPEYGSHGSGDTREPVGPAPREKTGDQNQSKHYYDGPIKFFRLAATLRPALQKTGGGKSLTRNVLFAASSLQSVANIIPMACQMGKWDRNYVHLAVFGRDPIPMDDILEINGVDKEECNVIFHDARPDYSESSSDKRAEVSVAGALKHINDFLHPQAIIMDDSSLEDEIFTRSARRKTTEYRRPLIEVPDGKYEEFLWMTRLDSGSLGSWFEPQIHILINAPLDSSGSLLRLLNTLKVADYSGLKPPTITIELPSDIEPFAKRHLEELKWPPNANSPLTSNTVALRHRISSSRVTTEQASLRFLESFYPASTDNSHVLLLSPQVEMSPLYLQYLHYTLLEYRYSAYGSDDADDMLGISLDVPTSFINGSNGFLQPSVADMNSQKYSTDGNSDLPTSSPFLYQAPSSTASLIFGDKWATFHDFLRNRMTFSHADKAQKPKKLVSETEPAWMEYLLELMRARGWHMLHPATPFVTVHNELARIPEEFLREKTESESTQDFYAPQSQDGEAFLTAAEPPSIQQHIEKDPDVGSQSLQDVLPFDGDLPELPHLPYVHFYGGLMPVSKAIELRAEYVAQFRRQIGGCAESDAERKRFIHYMKTDDLFCLPDTVLEFDEGEDESEEEKAAEAILKATDGDDTQREHGND